MRRSMIVLLFLVLASLAFADPPARVARLNLTQGTVSFRPAGIDQWTAATVNRPLIQGDELWTEPASRAELHIGSGAVRLGAGTSFGMVNETDRIAQMRIASGTVDVRLRRVGEQDTWEIDTPNVSVSLLKPGRYRVDVTSDGLTTIVASRGGEAEITASGMTVPVHPGQQASIAGTTGLASQVNPVAPLDGFDRWCLQRDQREDALAAQLRVSRELVGYEDLDASGTWRFVAGYGWAWTPTVVVAGWAPYRFGHWAWIEPWGWTWIDDAPWGFAPFHYGRWAYADGAWLWVPGTIVRPVYAPALVAFGGGPGWSAAVSVGAVAWWPLAPGEVFVPAYAVAPVYVRVINAPAVNVTQVNVTNVNVTNVRYANQGVGGAVTAVSQQSFVSAQSVSTSALPIANAQAAAGAASIGMTARVAPSAASVVGTSGAAGSTVAQPPSGVVSRAVQAHTPPPPAPIPFAARQQALAAHPGLPLGHAMEQRIRTSGNLSSKSAAQGVGGKAPNSATGSKPGPQPKVTPQRHKPRRD